MTPDRRDAIPAAMPTLAPPPDVAKDLDAMIAELRGAGLLDWLRERLDAKPAWTAASSISATKGGVKRGRPKMATG